MNKNVGFLELISRPARIVPLAGDASGREYSRLEFEGSNPKCVVKMNVHHPFDPKRDDWLVLREFLNDCGIPVPELFHSDGANGIIYMEDCGDNLMSSRATGAHGEELLCMYRKALDILVSMQCECTGRLESGNPAFNRFFDGEKYHWELNFAATHYIEGYCGKILSPADEERLANFFTMLINPILSERMVFTHRDYHSRNIMIRNDQYFVLDFQDARMGPPHYDLASILFDSYVELDDRIRNSLIDYYLMKRQPVIDGEDRKTFELMLRRVSAQRSLKALGTFGYQTFVKKNAVYEQFVPTTVRYLRRNLAWFSELEEDKDWVLSLLER